MTFVRLDKCEEAIEDACKALTMNPRNFKAIIQYGDALYGLGEFEKGLLVFQRGWKKRVHPKMLNGMHKCRTAIENSVGRHSAKFNAGLVEKVVRHWEKEKLPKPTKAELEDSLLQESLKTEEELKAEELKKEKRISKLDRLFLGRVAEDCSFLRRLAPTEDNADQIALSPFQAKQHRKIFISLQLWIFQRNIAIVTLDTLAYLERRKQFWQQTSSSSGKRV